MQLYEKFEHNNNSIYNNRKIKLKIGIGDRMNIIKFKILGEGDVVEKVENNDVHVRKANGKYVVYKMHKVEDEDTGVTVCSFDAFIITSGIGAFEVVIDADLDDLED